MSIRGASRDIYARVFEQVVGRQMEQLADMTGRTEEAIIRKTLELNGVDPSTSFEALYDALGTAARSLEPAMHEHESALPGAAEAIASFRDGKLMQLWRCAEFLAGAIDEEPEYVAVTEAARRLARELKG